MALRVQTQISGDVFILRCDGRLVFGDEGAALRERVGNMLAGSPRIVINLKGVHHIDSGGLGILAGLSVSARNRGGELKLVSPSKRVNDVLRRTQSRQNTEGVRHRGGSGRGLSQTSGLRDRRQFRKTD
jgi:anti-sigma B factor antagonist